MNNDAIQRIITFGVAMIVFYIGLFIGHKNGRRECEKKFMDKFLNDDNNN